MIHSFKSINKNLKKAAALLLACLFLLGAYPLEASALGIEKASSESTFSGEVSEVSSKSVTVVDSNGKSYTFTRSSDTRIEGKYELKEGSEVTVTYTGKLSSKPKATKIKVTASNAGTFSGTVTKISSKTFKVRNSSGKTYVFGRSSKTEISGKYVFAVGATVTVSFNGYYKNEPTATAIRVTGGKAASSPTPKPTATPKATAKNTVGTFSGEVSEVSSKSVTVVDGKGNEYTFSRSSDTKITGKYDLKEGSEVTVTYTGKLSSKPKATEIKVTASSVGTFTGTVKTVSKNSFRVTNSAGKTYVFNRSSKTEVTGKYELAVGATVTVTFDGYYKNEPTATSIKVTAGKTAVTATPKATAKATATPKPASSDTFTGEVSEVSSKSVTVVDSKGNEYTFSRSSDTKVSGKYSLKEGATVTVTFTGKLSSKPKATEIKVTESSVGTFSGTVKTLSKNSFRVTNSAGKTYVFRRNGSTEVSGKFIFAEGAKVTVTFDGYYKNEPMVTEVKVTGGHTPKPSATPKPTAKPTEKATDKPKATATVKPSTESKVDKLISVAQSKLGSKYVAGGKGPNTFDCSGFVYWCLKQCGVNISYMTSIAWRSTSRFKRIKNMSEIRRGDILVFSGSTMAYGHVGIYMGGGKMIDAGQSSGGVVIRSSIHTSYWESHFLMAYRIWT